MYLMLIEGDDKTATEVAKRYNAAMLELFEINFSSKSFYGEVGKRSSNSRKDIVVSMSMWDLSNSKKGMEDSFRDMAAYLKENEWEVSNLILVGHYKDIFWAEQIIESHLNRMS